MTLARRQSAVLVVLLLVVTTVFADARPLTARRIGPEQGLSQVTARTLAQDAAGLIWIGTENGLNVYDGLRFSHFRHDPEDPASLSDNYVRALLPDGEGGMWVGTLGGGLNRYVAATGRFIRYAVGEPGGLPSGDVEALLEAADGALWIGHGAGASRFDAANGRFTHFRADAAGDLGMVQALAQTQDGDLWLGRSRGGLRRIGADGVQTVELPVKGAVLAMHVASDGDLWVGTEMGGLFRIDPRVGEARRVPGEYDAEVTSILQDEQGAIWFGTWSGGLYRLDPHDGSLENHRSRAMVPTSLSSDTVIGLMRDRSGGLWVGTYDAGLNMVMPHDGALEHHAFDPSRPDGLMHSMVWSFAEDPDGAIWVGTRRGLNRFDPVHRRMERYLASGRCSGLGIGVDVRAVLPDRRQLWLGLADGGLILLDPESCTRSTYSELLTSRRVRLLLRDTEGDLWIGTDHGLNRLDPVSGWVRHYQADGREGSLPHSRIRSLYQDGHGMLWVGTSGGLSRYDPATDGFVTWTRTQGSLSDDDVRGIYRDESGILWLATGIGLTRLDPESGEARFFYERHGLSNNTLYSVIPDGPWLWITSNGGLTRFDRHTHATLRFDQGDGLQSNEFNFNAYLKTAAGDLLLGGIGGFNLLRPERLLRDAVAPDLHLAWQIGERRAAIGPAAPPPGIDPIELDGGSIRFEPRVLHYLNSKRNGYRYRLLGYDEDWVHAPATRGELSYSDLPAGEYRFQIVGFTGSGVESGPPLELALRVPRPLWRQPWIVLPGLAALLGVAWFLAALRTRALRYRAARLQAEVEAKTAEIARQAGQLERLLAEQSGFYRRIAHELKTPLTLVSLPLVRLNGLADRRTEVRDPVSTIARGVERLDQLVEELTDVALGQRDNRALERQTFGLAAFLLPFVGLYRHSAEAGGKSLKFAPVPDVAITLHRAVFEDVLHNLLTNAVKYSRDGGRISAAVELRAASGTLRLCVEDDGPGLSAADCERIFDSGFRTPWAMARDPGGHGEGLHICRSRLRAIGGEVAVQSEAGRYCRFIAEFPSTWSGEARPIGTETDLRGSGRRFEDGPVHDPVDVPPRSELLFVEDDPDLSRALAGAFQSHYRVHFASALGDGLKQAKEHMPNLVVCDRMLPDGDGLDLLAKLKADPDTSHIPVVILTALSDPASQQEGWRSLADDYVAKPFQPETLRLRIESHLENRRRTREWARAQLIIDPFDKAASEKMVAATEGTATDARYVQRLETAVFSRLEQSDCRLETVAGDLGQSPRTLQRKLQALYGCGFAEYVVDLQIRRARTLLEAGASVKRAALEAGFSSQSYMSRVFRKRLGKSPSEYRTAHA